MDSLFIRKKNRFVPTKKAEQLYPKVCEIVRAIDELAAEQLFNEQMFDCILALPATLCVGLPEYLHKLVIEANANINLSVLSSQRDICREIINGRVCIAITNCNCIPECAPNEKNLLAIEPIATAEFVYVVSHRDNLMWQENLVLENIAKYPFVVTQMPGFNDKLDPFEDYCLQQDIELNVSLRTQSFTSTIEAIISQQAVTFIGPIGAINFLSNIPLLRIEKLARHEYEKLHKRINFPTYSMLYLACKRDAFPELIIDGIKLFISESVIET